MRLKFGLVLLASTLAACQHTPADLADRGYSAVNVPVVSRSDYVLDVAAPGGALAPAEATRLDSWFRSLQLGYGDSVHVDGAYADAARAQIAQIAGSYGMLVSDGAPVTAGAVAPDMVRVVVTRTVASVPGCPNWGRPSQPNYNNRMLPNFGCAVNSNLAAMVANPEDLLHGREGSSVVDADAGAKAVDMYRNWPLTGIISGQTQRPLKTTNTRKDDK